MKTSLIIILFFTGIKSFAQAILPVRLQPYDKEAHFVTSAALSSGVMLCIKNNNNLKPISKIGIATCSAFAVGLLKESYDEYAYSGWSNTDLAYDFAGSVTGTFLTFGLNKWLIKAPKSSLSIVITPILRF